MRITRPSFGTRTRLYPFLVLPLLLLAVPAAAQDRSGTVEITPFAGAYFGGTLESGSNAVFDQDVEADTDVVYGLRLGVQFNNWVGVEFTGSYAASDVRYPGDDSLFEPTHKVGELKAQNYAVNGVFSFAKGRFVPYITLGAGASALRLSVPEGDTSWDTRFTSNVGAGLKMWATPHFGFRIDGRIYATYVGEGQNCDDYWDHCHDRDYYDDSIWYTSGEVTGGLTFAF